VGNPWRFKSSLLDQYTKGETIMKQYVISEGRLRDLLHSEAILNALENGGVDNWEWYGDSIRDFFKRVNEEEIPEDGYSEGFEEKYIDKQIKNFLTIEM
jgi:hypothetical protein